MMRIHRRRKFFTINSRNESVFSEIDISRTEQNDRMHDHNTDKFIECIKTSHNVCGPSNLVAIKVTALIRPTVLKKFNNLLKSIDNRSSLPSVFELINEEKQDEKKVEPFQQSIKSYLTKTEVLSYIFVNICGRI